MIRKRVSRRYQHYGIAPDRSERYRPASNTSNPCNLGNLSAVYTLCAGATGRYVARRLDRTGTRPGDRAVEKMRKPPTSLQQACNMLTTGLQLLPHFGIAPILPCCRSGGATAGFLQPEGRGPAPSGLRPVRWCRQDTSGLKPGATNGRVCQADCRPTARRPR